MASMSSPRIARSRRSLAALLAVLCSCGGAEHGGSSADSSPAVLPFGDGVPHAYEERYLSDHPQATLDPRHTVIFRLEADAADTDVDTGGVGTDIAPYTFARETDLTLTRNDGDPTAPTLTLKDIDGNTVAAAGSADHQVEVTVPPGDYTLEIQRSQAATATQTIFLQPVAFTSGAGTNQNDVAELMADKSCIDCDFTDLAWSSGIVTLVDLSHANFTGATLGNVSFEATLLLFAIFDQSTLGSSGTPGVQFEGAGLLGASLRDVTFASGAITAAVLNQAIFDGSNFFETCLSSPSLTGASFAHVTFWPGSGICGTDFNGSDLSSTTFSGTVTSNCTCGGPAAGLPVFIGAVLSQGFEGDVGVSFDSVDLSGANFVDQEMTGSSFTNCNLAGANLAGADLYLSTFRGSNLNGADVSQAMIDAAEASYASMVGISGVGTQFSQTDLTGADLTGAVLTGADMTNAFMPDAVLSQADLRGANLSEASLYGNGARVADALFDGASLSQSILSGVDFSRVHAPGANFNNAVLVNASFAGANLIGAKFQQTYLQGANFTGADVDGADFFNAILSDSACSTATPPPSGTTACWTYTNTAGYSYSVQFGATVAGSLATDIYGLVCPFGCTTCLFEDCPNNGSCDGPCGSQFLQPETPPSPAIPVCTPFEGNWCPPIGAGPFGRDAGR